MFQQFKTVSNTLLKATENVRIDAVNVCTAEEEV